MNVGLRLDGVELMEAGRLGGSDMQMEGCGLRVETKDGWAGQDDCNVTQLFLYSPEKNIIVGNQDIFL